MSEPTTKRRIEFTVTAEVNSSDAVTAKEAKREARDMLVFMLDRDGLAISHGTNGEVTFRRSSISQGKVTTTHGGSR
jgi:hypothetical protein